MYWLGQNDTSRLVHTNFEKVLIKIHVCYFFSGFILFPLSVLNIFYDADVRFLSWKIPRCVIIRTWHVTCGHTPGSWITNIIGQNIILFISKKKNRYLCKIKMFVKITILFNSKIQRWTVFRDNIFENLGAFWF